MSAIPGRTGLLGAGGQAAEIADYLSPDVPAFYAVEARFLAASPDGSIDIDAPTTEHTGLPVVVAVGAPLLKQELVARWPGDAYATIVHSTAYVAPSASVERGCVVAPLAAVGSRSRLGEHVLVNLGATVSHDVVVGAFASISPGVHIGGNCTIGRGSFVGIGATIRNGIGIAPGTVVGAGAVVVSDTVENGVYAGVPARLVSIRKEWLRDI